MAANWDIHKETLRTLYITRDETLGSIMVHGFVMKYDIW